MVGARWAEDETERRARIDKGGVTGRGGGKLSEFDFGLRRNKQKMHRICLECKQNEHREGSMKGGGKGKVDVRIMGERWAEARREVRRGNWRRERRGLKE